MRDVGAGDGASPRVRPLRGDEVEAAARVLGRAFHDDPLLAYALPDQAIRRERAAAHFTPVVRHAMQCGEVHTTDDLAGLACWRPPGRHDPTDQELADSGLDRMTQLIGHDADARLSHVFEFLRTRRVEIDVPDRHWYLAVLGVEPAAMGTGIGSALIQAKLTEARASGIPVFLETVEARNVSFYESNGFRCADAGSEPVSGLDYWVFVAA